MQTKVLKNVKLNWAKLTGEPRLNYSEDGYEWSVDVVIDADHRELLEAENIGDYFKEKNGETFFKYRRPSVYANGNPAKPVRVIDSNGKAWDPEVALGNGTTADIQITMTEMKRGKNKGTFKPTVLAVRVTDLVEYNPGGDDFGFSEAAETADIGDEWS